VLLDVAQHVNLVLCDASVLRFDARASNIVLHKAPAVPQAPRNVNKSLWRGVSNSECAKEASLCWNMDAWLKQKLQRAREQERGGAEEGKRVGGSWVDAKQQGQELDH
jgi:hypothetical protein